MGGAARTVTACYSLLQRMNGFIAVTVAYLWELEDRKGQPLRTHSALNPFPTLFRIFGIGIVADFGRLPTAPMAAYDRSDDCTHRPRTSSDGP